MGWTEGGPFTDPHAQLGIPVVDIDIGPFPDYPAIHEWPRSTAGP